jgi:uncharacterized protein (TIGR01777 family)
MKIVIAGASGFLGKSLTKYFIHQGYQVIWLVRSKSKIDFDVEQFIWDGITLGAWVKFMEGSDVLINLSGKSVDCRYTAANMRQIYDSRTQSTYVLGEAISQLKNPPKVWLNASSATIYRHAEDQEMDEETGEIGTGFSVNVCQKWERTFFETQTPSTRKVALRIAIVLGKDGGALKPLINLCKLRLGGKQGNGRQYFSWIDKTDFVRAVEHLIRNEKAEGVYNLSSPNPVPNSTVMHFLRNVHGVKLGIPAPKFLLEIGAFIIRTETELILKSRRVVPSKLLAEGFHFQYPVLESSLKSIISKP